MGQAHVSAVWLLCTVAATVLAAESGPARLRYPVLVLAFGAAFVSFAAYSGARGSSVWIALAAGTAAAWQLSSWRRGWVGLASAGLCAGIAAVVLHTLDVPLVLALATSVAPPLASAALSARRAAFVPDDVRDDALLLVFGGAVALAAWPALAEGWRAAAALNLAVPAGAHDPVPFWASAAMAAAALCGVAAAAHASRRRR